MDFLTKVARLDRHNAASIKSDIGEIHPKMARFILRSNPYHLFFRGGWMNETSFFPEFLSVLENEYSDKKWPHIYAGVSKPQRKMNYRQGAAYDQSRICVTEFYAKFREHNDKWDELHPKQQK